MERSCGLWGRTPSGEEVVEGGKQRRAERDPTATRVRHFQNIAELQTTWLTVGATARHTAIAALVPRLVTMEHPTSLLVRPCCRTFREPTFTLVSASRICTPHTTSTPAARVCLRDAITTGTLKETQHGRVVYLHDVGAVQARSRNQVPPAFPEFIHVHGNHTNPWTCGHRLRVLYREFFQFVPG
jgi:hypothetical protein